MATVWHPELGQTATVPDSTAEVLVESCGWELVDDLAPTTDPDGYALEPAAGELDDDAEREADTTASAEPQRPRWSLPGDGDPNPETREV